MGKLTDLFVNIGARTKDLDKGLNDSQNKLKSFSGVVSKIGGLIAGAFAVSTLVNFTKEIIKLSGETEGVKYAFDALNKPGLLDDLRKATKNTVSDLELMKSAVQANNFKIPLEQLGSLLKFAHLRAQQTGQSVDYLVQSIVLGIGRKSPLILDNLGISAIELRKKFKGVGVEMATVGDIAKAVGDIAEEEMAKSGEAIDTSTMAIDRMKTSWANLKVTLGDLVIPTVSKLVGLLEKAANGWKNIINPGALAEDLAAGKIQKITKELQGLTEEQARAKISRETSLGREAARGLSTEKQTKETKQLIQSYAIVDEWLTKLWKDSTALNAVISPKKEVVDEVKKTSEELSKEYENLLRIQKMFRGLSTPGMSRTDVGWYPKSGKTVGKLKSATAFEGSNSMKPAIENMDEITKKNEEIAKSFDKATIAGEKFSDIMSGSFSDIKGIKDFANAVKNAAKQVVAAMIAEAVATNIAKAVGKSKSWWGAVLSGAVAGAATAALFNAVPSFAEGGVVKGKQLAIVGDNPSGVEAMIPKELWGKMGGGQNVNIQGVVHGRDLVWVLKNQNDFMNKTI